MRIGTNAVLALVVATLAACGGSVVGVQGPGVDSGGTPGDDGGGRAPGTVLGDCGPNESCPAGSSCYYPIGNCDAKPECVVNPAAGTPECGAEELLCGCGVQATSGCGFPQGFASGPALESSGSCFGFGPPDAGQAPDATFPIDGGGPGDAAFPPEDADFGGPCSSGENCGPGYECLFPIGVCPAHGYCVAIPTGPGCGVEESLCGCDGVSNVTTGCGFPSGWASGPTDGQSFCSTGPKDAGLPFDANPPRDAGSFHGDASDGCVELEACCAVIPPADASLCQQVVSNGNNVNCATALQILQGDGYCETN